MSRTVIGASDLPSGVTAHGPLASPGPGPTGPRVPVASGRSSIHLLAELVGGALGEATRQWDLLLFMAESRLVRQLRAPGQRPLEGWTLTTPQGVVRKADSPYTAEQSSSLYPGRIWKQKCLLMGGPTPFTWFFLQRDDCCQLMKNNMTVN